MTLAALTRYNPDHSELFMQPGLMETTRNSAGRRLGGIVVSTSKSCDEVSKLPGLLLAARLATEFDCPLLVITSKAASATKLRERLTPLAGRHLLVVDLASATARWLPKLETSRHWLSSLHRDCDVGSKRNLGLVMSKLLPDCDTVLFLDDDIWSGHGNSLDAAGVRAALSQFAFNSELRAIGWTAESFPDNSVAGHARRWQGEAQEVFLGAGALLVDLTRPVPFFPDVYNEDWLFLIGLAKRSPAPQRVLGWAGTVRQSPYNPFVDVRAKSEEAGEVLGEALMNLIGAGRTSFNLPISFWRACLEERRSMLTRLHQNMLNQELDNIEIYGKDEDQRWQARSVLSDAIKVNRKLGPQTLHRYVQLFDGDTRTWDAHLLQVEEHGLAHFQGDALSDQLRACRLIPAA